MDMDYSRPLARVEAYPRFVIAGTPERFGDWGRMAPVFGCGVRERCAGVGLLESFRVHSAVCGQRFILNRGIPLVDDRSFQSTFTRERVIVVDKSRL